MEGGFKDNSVGVNYYSYGLDYRHHCSPSVWRIKQDGGIKKEKGKMTSVVKRQKTSNANVKKIRNKIKIKTFKPSPKKKPKA